MFVSFLFLLASIILIGFVVFKIMDPSSDAKDSRKEISDLLNLENEFNFGSLLLKVGPILLGFGLIGYLIQNFWDRSDARLILLSILTIVVFGAGYGLYYYNKTRDNGSKNLGVLTEALFLLGSFVLGAELFAINGYINDSRGFLTFGAAEIFGLWILFLIPSIYLIKSVWLQIVNLVLSVFFLSLYLSSSFNFIEVFGFDLIPYKNQFAFLWLPVIIAAVHSSIYAWHQYNNHQQPDKGWRGLHYMTGLLAYFTVGAMVIFGILENYGTFFTSGSQTALLADLLIALVALILFAADFLGQRLIKNYNINYLVAVTVVITAIFSMVLGGKDNIFVGFMFLEIPFIVWLLADFMRNRSQVAQVLFYGFNAIQLLLITTNGQGNDDWFKLVTLLGIILYAAIKNYHRRGFVIYALISGVVALLLELVTKGLDAFLTILVIGAIVTVYGLFYTQTRNAMIKENKKQNQIN